MENSLQTVRQRLLKKSFIVPAVFGLLLSSAVVVSLWANQVMGKLELLALWVGLAFVATLGLSLLSKLEIKLVGGGSAFSQTLKFSLSCFLVLETLMLIILLSNYPGFCSVDSNDIINQALGISHYQNHFRYEGLTNHHPVFYTFLFWLVWVFTGSSSDPAFAVFVFLIMQSLFLSTGIAWALGWFNKHCNSRGLVLFVTACSILSPVLLIHALVMWKDVPFAVVLLILVLKLYDYAKKNSLEKKDILGLFCLCLAMSLLRNNGIYISIVLLIYMIIVFKEARKKILGAFVSLIIVIGIIQGPLFGALSVSSGHFAESVSVPLQQIAAVAADDAGVINEEQESFLDNIRPIREMAEVYNPGSANPVKFSPSFSDTYLESHKIEFIKTWAEIVVANPSIAFRAWVQLTCGYWLPGFFADIGAQETIYHEQPVSIIGFSLNPHDYFSALNSVFPGLFSMGNTIWVVIASLGVLILCNRAKGIFKRATCFVPILVLELTLLVAAPIASDFRYVLGIYLVIPFLLVLGNLFGLDETAQNEK